MKIAVHTRTKAALIEAAVTSIKAGKAKTSYPRIVENAGIKPASLHAMLSPVTELPGGFTVIDSKDVAKLDAFLGADGKLLAIAEKGAKQAGDVKLKAEIPAKVKAVAVPAAPAEEKKPAAKKAAAPRKRATKKAVAAAEGGGAE